MSLYRPVQCPGGPIWDVLIRRFAYRNRYVAPRVPAPAGSSTGKNLQVAPAAKAALRLTLQHQNERYAKRVGSSERHELCRHRLHMDGNRNELHARRWKLWNCKSGRCRLDEDIPDNAENGAMLAVAGESASTKLIAQALRGWASPPADRSGSVAGRENATAFFFILTFRVGAFLLDGLEPDSSFSRCTTTGFLLLLLRVERKLPCSGERRSGWCELRSMAGLALPEERARLRFVRDSLTPAGERCQGHRPEPLLKQLAAYQQFERALYEFLRSEHVGAIHLFLSGGACCGGGTGPRDIHIRCIGRSTC